MSYFKKYGHIYEIHRAHTKIDGKNIEFRVPSVISLCGLNTNLFRDDCPCIECDSVRIEHCDDCYSAYAKVINGIKQPRMAKSLPEKLVCKES